MKTEQLHTFLRAAGSLNFTSTARELFLSQSAVSQQIRELESDLGVTLFERRGRGLILTPAGVTLQQLAAPIVADLKRVRVEMSAYHGVAQGMLRVGASPTAGVYLMPHAIGSFAQRFPGVQTSLAVAGSETVVRLLQEGELDVAVVEQETPARRLRGWVKQKLLEDELVLICRPDNPWAKKKQVLPSELCGQPLILRQKASRTRQRILDSLEAAGVPAESLKIRFELGHTEAIIQAVMAGLGVGFVSRFAVDTQRHAGVLREVPLTGVPLRRLLWLLRPVPERAFVHQERFCELLHSRHWRPATTFSA